MIRRSFLQRVVMLLAAVAASLGGWGVVRFLLAPSQASRKREIPLNLMHQLSRDAPFHVPEAGAWLRKTEPDGVVAFDDRCPHLGCRPTWDAPHETFRCPCHGSEFDPDGNVKRGPATQSLARLRIEENGTESVRLVEVTRSRAGNS